MSTAPAELGCESCRRDICICADLAPFSPYWEPKSTKEST